MTSDTELLREFLDRGAAPLLFLRCIREQEDSAVQNQMIIPAMNEEEIGWLLDKAAGPLPEQDHTALLRRFFKKLNWQDTGAAAL